jgi:hypothetical protein
MTPVLAVIGGEYAGDSFVVPDHEFAIGRTDFPADYGISRRHAELSRSPKGEFVIQDLGSANGTYVNGHRLTGPRYLTDGDTIELGETTLQLRIGPGGSGDTPTGARARFPQSPADVSFGKVKADRGAIVAGQVDGGIHTHNQIGDTISGATGFARFLIGLGLIVGLVGFGLFAYPIVMTLTEGFSGELEPGESPSADFVPFLPLGFGLAALGAALIQFGVFLKR